MKKLLAILLSALLVLGMTACQDKGTAEDFQKPENYATVLLVTINPQFRLYLDAEGDVLAVEPVNDDAKSIADKISDKEGDVNKVMESLVTAVDEGGFVKDGEVKVDLKVDEVKDKSVDTNTVLETVQKATDDGFKKIEIKAEVTISAAEKDEASAPANSSEDTSSEEHKHEFSAATCTAPKTCACGATEGSALGHKYSGAACTVCGAKNPNYVTPAAQRSGSWVGEFWYNNSEVGKTYYKATINFSEKIITGGGGGTALEIMGSPRLLKRQRQQVKPSILTVNGGYTASAETESLLQMSVKTATPLP